MHVRFCVGVWGVIPISTREKAIKGAKDYDKAASKYVQFLTGKDQADWSLVVLQNQALAQGDAYKDFYKTDYKATTNDWKTNLQLLVQRYEYPLVSYHL